MAVGTVEAGQGTGRGEGPVSPWEAMVVDLANQPQFHTPLVPTVLWDPATFAGPSPLSTVAGALFDLGLPGQLVESLYDIVAACATVTAPTASTATTAPDPAATSSTATSPAATPDPAATAGDAGGGVEAPAVLARARALLGAVETLAAGTGRLEAVLVTGTRALTAAHGKLLLAGKGATSPEELTPSQATKWRKEAQRVTRHELQAATGWGTGEVSDLVNHATTPTTVTGPAGHAMATGAVPWRLVRRFHRACAGLDTADAAGIANGLFGTDPDNAVTERLTSDGEFVGGPFRHQEFYRALDREVHKTKTADPDHAAKTRQQALAAGDVRLQADATGAATLTIGCTTTQGVAIIDRISKAAKNARAGGDERTLKQLRCAIAAALLLHGTLPLEDIPEDPDLITSEHTAGLTKILHALPTAQLNITIPLTTLLGTTPAGLHLTTTDRAVDADGKPIPTAFANTGTAASTAASGTTSNTGPSSGTSATSSCRCACTCGATPDSTTPPETGQHETDPPPQDGPAGGLCPPEPAQAPPGQVEDAVPSGVVGVGEVIGAHTMFLSPEQVRTLALTPGSTLYRLITDPVTGTLIERSTKAYRFDATMRAHIIAADVFCRAPGCLRPASLAQLDHVQEHGTPGGHTCISNGQAAHDPHHDLKTKKLWDAVIAANRDVTWTTLLGRIYTTKAHDYNQYTKLLTAATDDIHTAITTGTDPATAIDTAIYQALTYRPPGTPLETEDDIDTGYTGWHQITLTHTNPDTGRRRYTPDPNTTHTETDRHRQTQTQPDSQQQDRDTENTTGNTEDNTEDNTGGHDGPTTGWTADPDGPPPF